MHSPSHCYKTPRVPEAAAHPATPHPGARSVRDAQVSSGFLRWENHLQIHSCTVSLPRGCSKIPRQVPLEGSGVSVRLASAPLQCKTSGADDKLRKGIYFHPASSRAGTPLRGHVTACPKQIAKKRKEEKKKKANSCTLLRAMTRGEGKGGT